MKLLTLAVSFFLGKYSENDCKYVRADTVLVRRFLTRLSHAHTQTHTNSLYSVLAPSTVATGCDTFDFVLWNADDEIPVQTLQHGDVLSIQDWEFNIEAKTTGCRVESMRLELSGPIRQARTENVVPFTVFGDRACKNDNDCPNEYNANPNGKDWKVGTYAITATAYSMNRAKGDEVDKKTISFTVDNESVKVPSASPSAMPSNVPSLAPSTIPTAGPVATPVPTPYSSESQFPVDTHQHVCDIMKITFFVPFASSEPTQDDFWNVWATDFVFDRNDPTITYADAYYYDKHFSSIQQAMVYNAREKTIAMEWRIEIITPNFPYGTYDNLFIMDEAAYIADVIAAVGPDSLFSEITEISVSRPFATEESYTFNSYYCGH